MPRLVAATHRTRRPAARFVDPQLPQARQSYLPLRPPGARGHGPQGLLTAKVNGKTRTRTIPAAAVDTTRAQVAECQRRRRLTAALIAVSEDLCHARLRAETARGAAAVAAEKKSWAEEFAAAAAAELDRFLARIIHEGHASL